VADPFLLQHRLLLQLGTIGNPVFNLTQQLNEETHILKSDCPLYTSAGIPPPRELDDKVENDFNEVLRLTNKVSTLSPGFNSPSL